jgi:hypothetical protein
MIRAQEARATLEGIRKVAGPLFLFRVWIETGRS